MLKYYATLREANLARQAEWDPKDELSLEFRGNELAGEVGEACNVIKKLVRERMGFKGSRASLDQLEEELADVIICVDLVLLSQQLGTIEQIVRRKFNETSRKYGLESRLAESA